MEKREIVLLMIIMAMFVLVMLCMVKTNSIGRRLSELEFERQRSCNVSVSVMCVPTLPLETNEANFTNTVVKQDRLQVNNRLGFSPDSENIALLTICLSQWVEEIITFEEAMRCIDDEAKKTKS